MFGLNALSFVFSALLVWTVRAPVRGAPRPGRAAAKASRGVRAGFRFLFSEPVLRRLAVGAIVFVLGLAMVLVADAPVVQHFGAGSVGLGVLIGVLGRGLGARLVPEPATARRSRSSRPWSLGLVGMGLTLVAAGLLALVLADPGHGVPERHRGRDHPGRRAGHPAAAHAR